jgi:L-arabinose transport system substrate-binding protein
MKRAIAWVVMATVVMALTACTAAPSPSASKSAEPVVSSVAPSATPSASAEATPAPAKKTVKIAYISKMLTNPWFVSQDQGLKDKAKELGAEYFSIDANLSDEACDAAIDNALAQGINGLAICITNQGNGPALAMKCREKGVELITCDDNIVDENGKPVAHVGMPTKDVGIVGGEMLAKYANERNFFAPGNVVKVLQIDAPSVSVLKPRLDGYKEALMANTPLKAEDFIYVETKACMLEDSLAAAQATIAAHPEVTHWICGGVNDDSAVAFLKAIEEQGKIPQKNILACGLGGYSMAVEEFKKNNDSFMTVVLDPYREGSIAMETLYNKIVNGTPMPEVTYVNGKVATLANWKDLIK